MEKTHAVPIYAGVMAIESGGVKITRDGSTAKLSRRCSIYVGDVVATGSDSKATIALLHDRSIWRPAPGSKMLVTAKGVKILSGKAPSFIKHLQAVKRTAIKSQYPLGPIMRSASRYRSEDTWIRRIEPFGAQAAQRILLKWTSSQSNVTTRVIAVTPTGSKFQTEIQTPHDGTLELPAEWTDSHRWLKISIQLWPRTGSTIKPLATASTTVRTMSVTEIAELPKKRAQIEEELRDMPELKASILGEMYAQYGIVEGIEEAIELMFRNGGNLFEKQNMRSELYGLAGLSRKLDP